MKIVVINGTEIKGCTYRIKEFFLEGLREKNEITEFTLPRDQPNFCTGCKICFVQSEDRCPHARYVEPIWTAIMEADLLVFSYPVYALRTTGQIKALLDHFCCHWIPHRPEEAMFAKQAVILTNSVGAPNGGAQKDVATSLSWMGVSSIGRLGFGLMEGVIWEDLSNKNRKKIEGKVRRFSARFHNIRPARRGIKPRLYFQMCRMIHAAVLKKEEVPDADNQHWIDKGWLKPKKASAAVQK